MAHGAGRQPDDGGSEVFTMTQGSRVRGRAVSLSIVAICGVTAGLCPPAPAQSAPADTPLVFAGKTTTRGKVEERLSEPLREALDRWTEPAMRLDLGIALGERPEHIVIGHASTRTLIDAARWMDQAFDLLDPLVPVTEGRTPKVTVALLMDEKGVHSEAWEGLLAELEAQQLLVPQGAAHLRKNVSGLTLRQTPLFLQPTFDVAGNAAAGDDEFRLGNEIVHKYAQCLLTVRTGQQPASLLWGLGYVAETRLFDSVYHFNVAGFVAAADHADWNGRARELLDDRRKEKDFSLAALAADEQAAGRAAPPQVLTWAGLSFLAQKEPQQLQALWSSLAAVQTEADPLGVSPAYRGDPDRTGEVLRGTLDAIDPKTLSDFLKQTR
jgi:hypothetical protein